MEISGTVGSEWVLVKKGRKEERKKVGRRGRQASVSEVRGEAAC